MSPHELGVGVFAHEKLHALLEISSCRNTVAASSTSFLDPAIRHVIITTGLLLHLHLGCARLECCSFAAFIDSEAEEWQLPNTKIFQLPDQRQIADFEGLSARFDETSLVPVGLALVASLNLKQTFNLCGLQRTELRKADAAWCGTI